METNELKQIWQTLSNEKLIDKEIAKENIARIISQKSSKTVAVLTKKLKSDYNLNIGTSILIVVITIFATIFLSKRGQQLPVEGFIFLLLSCSFYAFRAFTLRSKLKLLTSSYNSSSILDSLESVKANFEKVSKKESSLIYISLIVLAVFGNVLINDQTDFSNYDIHSLQGYVLIFSIIYLVSLPWIGKYLFKKRFEHIIADINTSIHDLNSMK